MNLPPLLRLALGLTSLLGCTLEAERRGLLADCTFNDECEAPLICAARRCRAPCRTDRDCTNDWVCLPSGQEDRLVCYPPGTEDHGCVRDSDCNSPYVCGATRECIFQCRDVYDCRIAYPYDPDVRCIDADHTCSSHPRYAADGGASND